MAARPNESASNGGFTLVEVVITIAILMSFTVSIATMLRAGFDVKAGLSERSRIIHRLQVAIGHLANDVQHTFFVSAKDVVRNGIARKMKTVFRIDKNGAGDKLALTTRTHRAQVAGAAESEFTYVTYELRDSRVAPGRKDLFRGEAGWIPGDLRDEPPPRLLAKNVKTFVIEPWIGDRWSKDYWDTGRGDTRNRLPRMVKISLEAWTHDRTEGEDVDGAVEEDVERVSTVVYLVDSLDFAELKEQDGTIKWNAL